LEHLPTDYGGASTRHLDPDEHCPGKRHTPKIARKHLTLRTRIKRLARKTIGLSKTTQIHDIVLGLFVNRSAFGRAVETWPSPLLKHYPLTLLHMSDGPRVLFGGRCCGRSAGPPYVAQCTANFCATSCLI
jgi:hypothetical protein